MDIGNRRFQSITKLRQALKVPVPAQIAQPAAPLPSNSQRLPINRRLSLIIPATPSR
jgi:hypothetical protein